MKGRSIAAVFAGIIGGVILAFLLLPLVDKIYPPDIETLKMLSKDREAFTEYIRNLPAGFHFMGIAIGVVRLTAGLVIGGLIDKSNLMTLIFIGAFALLLAVLDVAISPHPVWYGIVYIPVIIGITSTFVYVKRKG